MRTGIANLPLHSGKAPRWLFERMTLLARGIITAIVKDFGPSEVLRRLSDPYWFQALGCVLGFDWHSSGITTTLCGAIKEGIKGLERELGLFVAGGKGGRSLKTPDEIRSRERFLSVDPDILIRVSRLSAKVDSAGLQDGYDLYHHCLFFTSDGRWAVVQQGMNKLTRYARRYHWLGEGNSPLTADRSFICEPHNAVCCNSTGRVLNMVASDSGGARTTVTELSWERPDKLIKDIKRIKTLNLPRRHHTTMDDINPERLYRIFLTTYERRPKDFEVLIGMEGIGPKTIRALALISELIYGVKPSVRDPVRFCFAHGGKDGHPYPVDRKTYDESIEFLRRAVNEARIGITLKKEALRRLSLHTAL